MEQINKEMEFFEKCPRCKSMSCTTELSSDDRKTKCSSCGFEGNILKFREHEGEEHPQPNKRPIDDFGKKGFKDYEQISKKIRLLKDLDINL